MKKEAEKKSTATNPGTHPERAGDARSIATLPGTAARVPTKPDRDDHRAAKQERFRHRSDMPTIQP